MCNVRFRKDLKDITDYVETEQVDRVLAALLIDSIFADIKKENSLKLQYNVYQRWTRSYCYFALIIAQKCACFSYY